MMIFLLDQKLNQLGKIREMLVADIVKEWTQEPKCINEGTLAIDAFKSLSINVSSDIYIAI